VRDAQRSVPFPLMVPDVLESSSSPDALGGDVPIRVYDIADKQKALRLVFRRSGVNEYWGVEETGWQDAPILKEKSVHRVTGGRCCCADPGHEVVVRDILPERIEELRAGRVPMHEPGLEELLGRNAERLTFTLDVQEALAGAEFAFVAVGTPPTYSGDADLSAVWTVVDSLPKLDQRLTLVMKSTVPVGTGEKVRANLDVRGLGGVAYVSNPEFLAEGTAVRDFMQPDRVV